MTGQDAPPLAGILPAADLSSFLAEDFEVRPRLFHACPFVDFGFDLEAFFTILRDTPWQDSQRIQFFEHERATMHYDLSRIGIEYHGHLTLDMLLMMKARKISVYVRGLQHLNQSLRALQFTASRSGLLKTHINAFFSPASAQAAGDHWDTHDLIALQISGHKEWHVNARPDVEAVIDDTPFLPSAQYTLEPTDTYVLGPGDALYLPRGCGHRAVAMDDDSLHLVLGLYPIHWHDLLDDLVASLTRETVPMRRSVLGSYAKATPEVDEHRMAEVLSLLTPETMRTHLQRMIDQRAATAQLRDFGQTFVKDIRTLTGD